MNPKEIRERRSQLEVEILRLISQFETDTETHVTSVSITDTHTMGSRMKETIAIMVDVEL